MKVSIGSYPNTWYSTYSIERAWFEWRYKENEEPEIPKGVDLFVTNMCDIGQSFLDLTINKFAHKRKRKVDVTIHPFDTWNMDTTLALIILPMLHQLQATKQSYPEVDDKDTPHLPKKKKKNFVDSYGAERWDWVLGEMIWSFEQIVDDTLGESYYTVPYKDGEAVNRIEIHTMETSEKRFLLSEEEALARGRFDKELFDEYTKRIERGLMFFGKYYRSLWD
jgi:hypothetical protein